MIREREYVKSVYPSTKWARRVDRMGDEQVFAIYIRLMGVEQTINDELQKADTPDMQLRLFP
jgi:hypothetical protein